MAMSAPKVHAADDIDFLIATPKACSGTEAAPVQPDQPDPPAHEAFTRLLTRREPDPETLWAEAQPQVRRAGGVLVVDDSTPDEPYATALELVTRHGSGKHHAVVRGINLVPLLWTDGDRHLPCDYRVYDEVDRRTKNDHLGDTIRAAHARKFRPRCVVFDGWYRRPEDLKLIRNCGWVWLTRLRSDRLVNRDRQGTAALEDTAIAAAGTEVWRPGLGLVEVFGIATPNGGTAYRATNDLGMTDLTRVQFADGSRAIAHYHRGIEPCTGIERCQCRTARAQRNHIGLALRAFLRFEAHCFARGISWVEAKTAIIRDAVRAYLNRPHIRFPRPLTA